MDGDAMRLITEQASVIENEYVRGWKGEGRKVVGFACIATPVEVMEAAGLLPYRLTALGNPSTEIADAHLSRFNCGFCRSLLQLGLDGTYDFLDGLIETNGCDHLRGMFENWQYVKPSPFFHYLKVPHITTGDALDYFRVEVRLFKEAVEKHFGVEIKDDDLWRAIENQDKVRERLRKVFAMREGGSPAFTGAETLSILLFSSVVPAETSIELIDRAIEERKGWQPPDFRARLMLCGSASDEVDLISEIEGVGGLIVTDALCYGTRAFWKVEKESDDPVVALADMYLKELLCPRMFDDYPRRRDYVLSAVERAAVDGIIVMHNKFCDVHGVDNVQLRMDLEKDGIPVLQLEKEYGAKADFGRIRTRVQAFLEKIGGRRKVGDRA
ncbi:2-hydroxyacyl-CoA dehydratase family protein [Candidatus Bathyarchaeota archaeon]|nr:2-hydroxyacyl-CoA dehydratase family protein [Candidatus Bathyarchaeota archaeon]